MQLTKDISKLIEAVNRVGIQNVSLLARMTGMPTETIRYTMKKRFPKMGLNVRTPLNHGAVGLERYFVTFRLGDAGVRNEAALMKALSSSAFLTYRCEAPVDHRHLAFFSVPVALADEFRSFLDRLVSERLVIDYSSQRLEWSRHPELKSRYYNFGSGQWAVDWETIRRLKEPPPQPAKSEEASASPDIDVTDTLIIKELELDSWRNIADIARKLGQNERTIRWHYRKHVADVAQSSYVSWFPVTKNRLGRAVGLVHEFTDLSRANLAKARLVFNNFPFAWFEGGNGGYYQVHSAMPAEYFMESVRFLNESLNEASKDWRTWTVDLSTIHAYSIPYENFGKDGWTFDQATALKQVLPQALKIK